MMPARAMKPIIDVAVKGAWNSQCPTTMPTSVSGIGVSYHQRQLEAAELRDHQDVDAENCHTDAAPR